MTNTTNTNTATHGMMEIDVPHVGTRFAAWARIDTGESFMTDACVTYTDAYDAIRAECAARGWVLRVFDGHTVHPANR